MKELLLYFWYAKKVWRKPTQAKLLIYDIASGVEVISRNIPSSSIAYFETRGESINLYVLLLVVLNWKRKSLKLQYIYHFVKCVKPIAVVTFIDNDLTFYQLKSLLPEIVFISIQNGIRGPELFDTLSSQPKENWNVDYLYCFNEDIAKKYRQCIVGKVDAIGSIKNNFFEEIEKEKSNTLIFISQFRNRYSGTMNTISGKSFDWEEFYSTEKFLLRPLQEYCLANNIRLQICGTTSLKDGEEYEYFRDLIGDDQWDFFPRNVSDIFSSYKILTSAKYCVFISSTMGYEVFARGQRAAGICLRGLLLGIPAYNFGWPAEFSDKGKFWTNIADVDEVNRVLDYITKSSDAEWNETYIHYRSMMMEFDKGNTKYLSLLKELNIIENN